MGPYGPADRSLMPAVAAILADWGAIVEPIRVSERLIDVVGVRVEQDLYVLKDKSDVAMSIAAALHEAGAAVLNPYPISAMLRDRILTIRVLQSAGVPTPETFVASRLEQLRPAVEQGDRKSTRLNSSHTVISYAVFCLKKKKKRKTGRVIRYTSLYADDHM